MTDVSTATGPEPPSRADLWFDNPVQQMPCKPTGPFSATADGACPVEFDGQNLAYVKPNPTAARNLVVAREKIAADLAYLLGFPVAPALVREPDPAAGWPHHSLMSLVVKPTGRTWGASDPARLALAGAELEALRVFWTWIGDVDHNGHPNNLLYCIEVGVCSVWAIDHSYSLCHANSANSLAAPVSQGYGSQGLAGREAWTRGAADKIASLEWARIEEVVRRLQAIVSVAEQDKILKILQERRNHLRTFLGI